MIGISQNSYQFMKLPFCKYHGAGNDFILIDNMSGDHQLSGNQINTMCHRRFGIGADGLMLIESAPLPYSYSMNFYNSDGTAGTMCGNGGRCLVAFAESLGLKDHFFYSIDGAHRAYILESGNYKSTLRAERCGRSKELRRKQFCRRHGSLHLVKLYRCSGSRCGL